MAANIRIFILRTKSLIKIWKKLPFQFRNFSMKFWSKYTVAEHEYIYIAEIRFEKKIVLKWWSKHFLVTSPNMLIYAD